MKASASIRRHRLFHSIIVLLAIIMGVQSAQAAQGDTQEEMVIATREAPPFVMRDDAGRWHGLAISLWDAVAKEQERPYRLVEADLPDMIEGVRDGRYDASVGALTITPMREEEIDFTHPYYTTGFGIAVHKVPPTWLSLFRNFFSWSFLQAILLLAAILTCVGLLFWLAERKHNHEQFGGGRAKGIFSGFWFSAVTMTTVGYGDKAPVTPAGKLVALVWMFAAIIIISTFTGMIASSLTTDRISGAVASPTDLPSVVVGSIKGSSSDDWLSEEGVRFRHFDTVESGLAALRDEKIGAFVYDKPILQYMLHHEYGDALRLVPGSFGRQDYGIALPAQSPLREEMNLSLLKYIEGADWQRQLDSTLGVAQ
ncbi:MAG: transporter substrate-binding domain-containing protein [Sphingobium sp.]